MQLKLYFCIDFLVPLVVCSPGVSKLKILWQYTLWFIKTWQYICDHNSRKSRRIFNNFYVSGNGNECPLQVSCLLIYLICDVNMTSLSRSWHWWAATASAACMARLGTVAGWCRGWPMANRFACLCSCHWWTFWTPCDCQFVFCVFDELCVSHQAGAVHQAKEYIIKVWNVTFHFHKVAYKYAI